MLEQYHSVQGCGELYTFVQDLLEERMSRWIEKQKHEQHRRNELQ